MLMSRLPYFFSSSLGRKYIMALTGLLLGGFLVVHAAGNSLIFQSREAFTAYADHLHSLGLLLPAAGLLLLAVFLLHILTGFSLALHNWRAKGSRPALCKSPARWCGWPARIMPYSGVAVLAFLLLHLATVRFADQTVPVAERISQTLTDPLLAGLYAAGIAALGLHISHGFWSLTQSLGLNHPRWNWLLRTVGCLCGSLSISVFAGIILLHLA